MIYVGYATYIREVSNRLLSINKEPYIIFHICGQCQHFSFGECKLVEIFTSISHLQDSA